MSLPLVMTCGDPAGIGPEIAVAARARGGGALPFVWIGDPAHLPPGAAWQAVDDPAEAGGVPDRVLPVLVHPFPAPATPGTPDPANAAAVIAVIERAVGLVQAGAAAGVVTCPINKAALIGGAAFGFPGHTEYLAHLAGVDRVVMMLACPDLRVVPVTIHMPLRAVPDALTPALLEETLRITHAALIADFGVRRPRLAVAGLNPHAGEGGAMGDEDARVIAPVLARLRGEGLDLRGPLPADTMFHAQARAGYDVAICMYHDQALIPIKTVDFAGGVNVTLGLPFVRSSPDHGTAYDIAGQGVADPTSLIAALAMARDMAARRARAA
ncbi:MAG: 4-hydroxythreonine-4-phosphate dehydrogenase PdxA [Rhodobacteraceae bacterium]|nr:4-hydroxythreonine-4-phosphate dehydrogenase PdxA [Paracoccaceae bacterium]